MTANTSRTPFPGSSQPGQAKPTAAATALSFLHNPPKKANAAPSKEDISLKAYEIWLATGKEPGRDQEHWFQAEQELSRS
jgi:Protein of unknown function (DUF2934)